MNPNPNGYTPKILVVDDEERIREGCRAVLSQSGFEVASADSGKTGLKMIEDAHYDIVLLDLMMPQMSGLEVLPQLKAAHPDTAVIVITGYATLEHSIEAMKAGAFDFIPKPFTPDQLTVVVEKAIAYTRALQDIANEKSRMRGLVNRLSDGVLATDSRGRIVLANPSFLKMMRYSSGKVIDSNVKDLIHHPAMLEMIHDVLSGSTAEPVEKTREIKIGDETQGGGVVLNVHCAPFRDRSGVNLGSITVLHDITALKEMDRMKSDFVSMVSHEIRSPLNSILMQIRVVLDGLAGEVTEKQKQILGRVAARIQSLVDLATDLLDLSKIESGPIALEKENVQLNQIITDQIALYNDAAAAAGIALEFAPDENLPTLMANRTNMEEVLGNLISNAIKYSPEGGRVRISAAAEADGISLQVQDEGLGIPPEEQTRIFDRFYRVKNSQTRSITGTGLGLAIVKRIVEAHGGSISVKSTQNKGTTFKVQLPIMSD